MMLRTAVKVVVVAVTSAVAIPYSIALGANLVYGWPLGEDRFLRALHPRKVLALNIAALRKLELLKYLRLCISWNRFYSSAAEHRLLKEFRYGENDNSLDLYFPMGIPSTVSAAELRPIVMFLYGGAWGSGDKAMYALLCSQLADQLGVLVVCPNYSTYPRGYVDDMVNDVVDCLHWLQINAESYGGDKDHVMLVGHSAGAHLCLMAVLELTLKQLMLSPGSLTLPEHSLPHQPPPMLASAHLQFEEAYFDGSAPVSMLTSAQHSIISASFVKVDTCGSSETDSFCMLEKGNGESSDFEKVRANSGTSDSLDNNSHTLDSCEPSILSEAQVTEDLETIELNIDDAASSDVINESSEAPLDADTSDTTQVADTCEAPQVFDVAEEPIDACDTSVKDDDSTDEEVSQIMAASVDTTQAIQSTAQPQHAHQNIDLLSIDDTNMTRAQKDSLLVLNSVKAVIGLAGVYDINDHYEHERWRGVEDVSSMHKAMYGPEHFTRFSPSCIVQNFPPRTRLPPITLIHGTEDGTVPCSSSTKLASCLTEMGGGRVANIRIPDCDHTDICMDLMDPHRTFHSVLMEIVKRDATMFLS